MALFTVQLVADESCETTLQGVRSASGEWEMTLRAAKATVRQLSKFGLFAVITDESGDRVTIGKAGF